MMLASLKEKPDGRIGLWLEESCYQYYVKQRRNYCTFTQLMDLWIRAPLCADCEQSAAGFFPRVPDISGDGWESDILIHNGGKLLRQIKKALRRNRDYALTCRRCHRELRPWSGDEVYVEQVHVEEHFGLPMETPGRRQPSNSGIGVYTNMYFEPSPSDAYEGLFW
jgi:hypothetical protein